ncbi:MAG TPA: putative Ig domain-containing protein [Candidatus Dormibacteraeota bacterium]|nr:putative Ig domain-containing protein [Candidatus Dormibacteraeota bacterium]
MARRASPQRFAALLTGAALGASLAFGGTSALAAAKSPGTPSPGAAAAVLGPGQTTEPGVGARAHVGSATSAPVSGSNGAYTSLTSTRLLDTRTTGQTLGTNGSLNLTVTGGTVPTDAIAVDLNVTVTNTTGSSFLAVYPAGEALPSVSNLNWVQGETVPNSVIVPVGANGQVTLYNDAGRTDVVVDLEGYFAPVASNATSGRYVPLTAARIADTRPGSGEPYSGDTLGPGGTLSIQVAGRGGVPTTGVMAALMNVTATDTSTASYLTVYPQGSSTPMASNLNWVAGETVANRVLVPVNPSTGQISLYNSGGSVDVVVDVDGYFVSGGTAPTNASLFVPISPIRVLDTRATGQTLGPSGTLSQQMAGSDGIGSTATAVVTNVTAVNATAPSYLTVYPGGVRPLASDVNWLAGQVVPNLTVATLSSSGSITLFNDAGKVDVLIDAFGYFVPRGPLAVTTTSLANPALGVAYSATLSASGGTSPYSWALASGSLPPGLGLGSTGVISGTPSVAGTSRFTVQVTDSTTPTAETATAPLSLSVQPPALKITATSLPSTTVGAPYSTNLSTTGGTPPYAWALTAGSLPSGLSLSAAGVIAGQASTAGTFSFGVQVTDSTAPMADTATAAFSLSVSEAVTVTTASVPGATVAVGYSVSLSATGGSSPYSWTVISGSLPAGLILSSSGVISGKPAAAGTSNFEVQVTDSTTPTAETASAQLMLTVLSVGSTALASSGYGPFGNATITLTATAPSQGTIVLRGSGGAVHLTCDAAIKCSTTFIDPLNPTNSGGVQYSATWTASSGGGSDTATTNVYWNAIPVISSTLADNLGGLYISPFHSEATDQYCVDAGGALTPTCTTAAFRANDLNTGQSVAATDTNGVLTGSIGYVPIYLQYGKEDYTVSEVADGETATSAMAVVSSPLGYWTSSFALFFLANGIPAPPNGASNTYETLSDTPTGSPLLYSGVDQGNSGTCEATEGQGSVYCGQYATSGVLFLQLRTNAGSLLGFTSTGGTISPAELAYFLAEVGIGNSSASSPTLHPYHCVDPVNMASGDLYESATDINVPGRGMNLTVSRSYNSLSAATAGPFGYGWTSNLGMSLAENSGNSVVTITDETGSPVTFTLTSGA